MSERRRSGGQFQNQNRATHGVHSLASAMRGERQLDKRTWQFQYLQDLMHGLATARGEDSWDALSPQLRILSRVIAFKSLILSSIEALILAEDGTVSDDLRDRYLRWSGSVRNDLSLFGLERVPKVIAKDLQEIRESLQAEGGDETE